MKLKVAIPALLASFGLLTVLAQAPAPTVTKRPEVPFVPTPEDVVAEMLKLAAPTKDDVVYDLGSGDGRIVIAAAKQSGATGVGIDIDPERIAESRENATKAGVSDKVKFIQQDLFETDLRPASVVTMYLLPDVNMRLRPKLLRELKPGSRVVSHNYHLGDWQPEKTVKLGTHTVYYWVVPQGGDYPKKN